MGQKTNPISLRLQKTNKFYSSNWYSKMFYSDIFKEEITLQEYINNIYTLLNYSRPLYFFNINKKHKECYLFFSSAEEERKNFVKFFRIKKKKLFLPVAPQREQKKTIMSASSASLAELEKRKKLRRSGTGKSLYTPNGIEQNFFPPILDRRGVAPSAGKGRPQKEPASPLVITSKIQSVSGGLPPRPLSFVNTYLFRRQLIKNSYSAPISKIFCKRLWADRNSGAENKTFNNLQGSAIFKAIGGGKDENYEGAFFFKKLFIVMGAIP